MLLNIKLQKLSLSNEQSSFIIGQTPFRLVSFRQLDTRSSHNHTLSSNNSASPNPLNKSLLQILLGTGGWWQRFQQWQSSTRIIHHHPTSYPVLLQCFLEEVGGVVKCGWCSEQKQNFIYTGFDHRLFQRCFLTKHWFPWFLDMAGQ